MARMIDIDITLGGDYQKSMEVTRKFSRRFKPAVRRGLQELGQTTARELKMRYRRGHPKPLSFLARRKRRIGKAAGKWPPVPPYGSSKALVRSGALANAMTHKKTGDMEYRTFVRPVMGPPAGGGRDINLGAVSIIQETGGPPIAVAVSFRMRNYLRVLAGVSRGGTGRTPEGFTGKTMFIRVPARPIWGPYFNEIVDRYVPNLMARGFMKGLAISGAWGYG